MLNYCLTRAFRLRFNGLVALFLIVVGAAQADTRTVTPETLRAELVGIDPGTTLLLEPGNYGAVSLRNLTGQANAAVVLRSADPADPAVIAQLDMRQVQHVTLDALVFDYTFQPGDPLNLQPFKILSSAHVTISNSLFDGDEARNVSVADDGFGTGFGIWVRRSQSVTLTDNEIRGFFRGSVIFESADIIVRNNDLHDIRMDGMNFAQVEDVLIEGNHIHDFNRSLDSTDHADMIQFWTASTDSPSQNITIRNNVLNSGDGWYTQSIFMRNELVDRGTAGPEMFYRNVVIENNVILNAHAHGITVGESNGLTIRHNTLVRNARSEGVQDNPNLWTPQVRISAGAQDVTITNNVLNQITGFSGQAGWDVAQNFFVQDQSRLEEGFYGTVFVPQSLSDPTDIRSFAPLAGGPLDETDLGAALLRQF